MGSRRMTELPAVDTLAPELSREYLAHHGLCPRGEDDIGRLVLAASDDSILDGIDDIAFAYRRPATVELVPRRELEALIERLVTRSDRSVELARIDAGDE